MMMKVSDAEDLPALPDMTIEVSSNFRRRGEGKPLKKLPLPSLISALDGFTGT
jgi:hypothetical protein